MAYKLLDFLDIQTAIAEELKIQMNDLTTLNRIKRMVNMMYIDEVVPAARWWWLSGHTALTTKKYYASGTASVTPLSTSVTLSVAPSATEGDTGSLLGWKFSVDGKSDIYTVTAHTALSTAVTIDRPFNTDLNAAANFKFWKDYVVLPTDCRETVEVWHEYMNDTMEAKGLQELRKIQAQKPKLEGRPQLYSTYDFEDPSTGDSELESDRYRMLKIHPAIYNGNTILKVDYIKEVNALDADGDEPLMPIEDRIVLFYGALSLAWGSIGRNPEEAMRNRQLFDAKLARMMGKIQDTLDKPRIEPQSTYINAKRGSRIAGFGRRTSTPSGSSSSYSAPSFLQDVTINRATVTGNFTVNPSITIDGRDISVDGASLDAHIAASADVHGLTGGASVVGDTSTQTLTNKTINSSNNTITNIADINIGIGAAIARNKIASGTADKIIINDGTGILSESAFSESDLAGLAYISGLTSSTLTDNTGAATLVPSASWVVATYNSVQIEYTITRGSANIERGLIMLASDGTSVALAQGAVASLGTLGITFTADVNTGNLRLLYTSTSTGTNGIMKWTVKKWLA